MEMFELGSDPSNVHEWDFEQGVREFLQGWMDNSSGGYHEHSDNTLTLTNYNTKLPRKSLLAGYSTKRNDSSQRGKFGDGLTSGICVLLREGMNITIYNSDVIWKPVITYSDSFEHEVVAIEETINPNASDDYSVVIEGVSDSDMERIIDNTLFLQDDYEFFETSKGTILLEEKHKGKVFVGDLYVDNFDSEYGFNFLPECFELDRDRKSLKPFDIQWTIKDLIAEMSSSELDDDLSDRVVSSMESNDKSMQYVESYSIGRSENFKKSAEKLYNEKYDGMILTSDYSEAEELRESGNKNVAYVNNSSFVTLVKSSESHQVVYGARKEKETFSIDEMLDKFEDEWQHDMNVDMYEAWEKLSNEIKERT